MSAGLKVDDNIDFDHSVTQHEVSEVHMATLRLAQNKLAGDGTSGWGDEPATFFCC